MATTLPARVAAGILALEAVAVGVVFVWELIALVTGDTSDPVSAIALLALTALGALALGAFAVATWRGLSWGRSGGIVAQLLLLAVAGGALTGPVPSASTAMIVGIPALIALALLLLAVRAAAPRREDC